MTEQTLHRSPHADFDAESVEQPGSEDFIPSVGIQSEPESSGVSAVSEPSVTKIVGWGSESDGADIDYVPVSPWAPIALCMGLLGLTGFIGYFGLYVAFFGIFVGIGAIIQIRSSGEFVKGTWMATLGLILSICSFSLGAAKMSYDYKHEVPEGYLRVHFPKDVAETYLQSSTFENQEKSLGKYVNQALKPDADDLISFLEDKFEFVMIV